VENGLPGLDLTILNLLKSVETVPNGSNYPKKLKNGLKMLSNKLTIQWTEKSIGWNSMMLYGLKKEKLLMLTELINLSGKLIGIWTEKFLTLSFNSGYLITTTCYPNVENGLPGLDLTILNLLKNVETVKCGGPYPKK